MGDRMRRRGLLTLLALLVLPSCAGLGAGPGTPQASGPVAQGPVLPYEPSPVAPPPAAGPSADAPEEAPVDTPVATRPVERETPVPLPVVLRTAAPPVKLPRAVEIPRPPVQVELPTPPPGPPNSVRIQVPEVHIDLPVVPGDGTHVAPFEAALYPYLGVPGSGQRSMIYAHARKGMFGGLFNARVGDHVDLVRPNAPTLHYRISAYYPAWPVSDTSPLAPLDKEQLLLITCTTYNPDDPRQLVIADPA